LDVKGIVFFHTHHVSDTLVRPAGARVVLCSAPVNRADGQRKQAGSGNFPEASKKPYTPRVKNMQTSSYHVVDAELQDIKET